MSRTKISVLIPVYNGEGYVGKAIRSILGQTYRDLEVVVLDDGSSDNSARVARSFGDSRVRVYRREEHEGIPATRNHLLMVARAPLVGFLDADDVAAAERLERQVEFLDRHRDYALVSCGYDQIDPQGQSMRRRTLPQEHDALSRRLLHGNAMPTSTVVLRREAIDAAGGFDATLGLATEYDLFLKVAEKARIGAIRESLVKCRVHSRAASYECRHELRTSVDEALRRAVRRRYRRHLDIARKNEDPQPYLFQPTGEPAGPIPAELKLVAPEPGDAVAATATEAASVEAAGEAVVTMASAETTTASASDVGTAAAPAPAAPAATPAAAETTTSGPQQLALGELPAVATGTTVAATVTGDLTVQASSAPAEVAATARPAGEAATTEVPTSEAADGAATTEPAATETATDSPEGEAGSNDHAEVVPMAASAPAPPAPPLSPTEREAMVAVVIEASGRGALAAIKSVLDQTLTDLVVAVVAVHHDDGLERGLELLADERVLLLECEGGSRARAMNLGILATRSRYIAYLGENGIYRSEHLDKLVQAAEADRLGLVYSDVGLATAGVPGTLVTGRDYDGDLLLKENFIPTEAVLHRRDLLHDVGLFNEGLEDGAEWEMWVYLTRVGAARRIAQPTVERVVGGPKAARLIATSPNRVRRYLADKFSKAAPSDAIANAPRAEENEPGGDRVQRAQERIRRGDWAGAAAELVDAASRQISALSELISPRYPERELPLGELQHHLVGEPAPALLARPRPPAAAVEASAEGPATGSARPMPTDILPHRMQAAAGPVAMPATTMGFGLGNEPPRESYAPAESASRPTLDADAAGAEPAEAPAAPHVNAPNWIRLNGHLVPRQRQNTISSGRMSSARSPASRPAMPRPAAHSPLQGKRKRPIETVTQHPACPLCGATGTTLAYRAGWYRVLDCASCNLGFSFPRLEPARATRFFSDRRPEIVPPHIRTAADCAGSRYDRSRELGWARRYVREGRLVDIGCSWGYAMAQAAELGYQPFGIELSRVLARTARERFGFEVKERDFTTLELSDAGLDVVLALHVIQHFVDPAAFFQEAFRTLRPGGVLVGSLPNFNAYLRDELGRRWKWLDPECQPYHFRPASLASLLGRSGFEAEVWTSEGSYGDDAILELLTADEAREVARSGRGSEIGFVARRPA